MSDQVTEPRATMTIRQAAATLGVHENTIRNWINTDLIEAYRLPGPGRYRRPYTDSVLELVPDPGGSLKLLHRLMLGRAERLEEAAAALRRGAAMLEIPETPVGTCDAMLGQGQPCELPRDDSIHRPGTSRYAHVFIPKWEA